MSAEGFARPRRRTLILAVLVLAALVIASLATGYGEWRLRHPQTLRTGLRAWSSAMFSPSGEAIGVLGYVDEREERLVFRLLSASDGHVIWDLALRNDVRIVSISFSPSGGLVAVADSEGVSVYSTADASLVRRIGEDLQVFGEALPWSASGRVIAVNREDGLAFRSVVDGALVLLLRDRASYSEHRFCYKGGEWLSFVGDDLLAAFDVHGLDIFSIHERKIVRRLDTLGSSPAAFSPRGDRFVCTLDRPRWRLAVYSLPEGERLAALEAPGLYERPIALSRDGEILAWHGDDGITIASVATGRVLRRVKSQGELVFSPTADLLAVSRSEQGVIELWPFRR